MNALKPIRIVAFLAGSFLCSTTAANAQAVIKNLAKQTVAAARAQIGVTLIYDPAYIGLSYPNGDLDRKRGVCSDVVIRALRDAQKIDLQQLVHQDMKRNFAAYPTRWGLKRTDKNIDHRRVLNLRRFFTRKGIALPISSNIETYRPGDIVSWDLGGALTHIGVVAEQLSPDGTPLIIHNIGRGAERNDILFKYEITGHFRPSLKNW